RPPAGAPRGGFPRAGGGSPPGPLPSTRLQRSMAGCPTVTAAGRPVVDHEAAPPAPTLVRSLGALDGALITIGASVGSGIFLTTGDIARLCPQPALILGLWAAGGLFALAGALAYGELGAMFPRAGGQYPFPKHA